MLKDWLGLIHPHSSNGVNTSMSSMGGPMWLWLLPLIRNASIHHHACDLGSLGRSRVFNNISTIPTVVFDKIKIEVYLWGLAGAKHLKSVMVGE